jgi:hypothetical protein
MAAGHTLTRADIVALRPASELAPGRQQELVGSVLGRDIDTGMPFRECDLDGGVDSPVFVPGAAARDSDVAAGLRAVIAALNRTAESSRRGDNGGRS